MWLREPDLNRRPSGYEPDELPNCSIPRPDALFKSMSLFPNINPKKEIGAIHRVRTDDLNLGKVALYQLS
jgi:hypothetical protein